MILYNLFPLMAGPFSRWNDHFQRAARMGFDWVFINPIQQLGASRSLYSIADYFRFNPALLDPASPANPEDQVRQMTRAAHDAGFKSHDRSRDQSLRDRCAADARASRMVLSGTITGALPTPAASITDTRWFGMTSPSSTITILAIRKVYTSIAAAWWSIF